ncbi:Plectin [Collichthys lucidus]|uniref:Plectin n=1 Tax=Collichthys lucidus TaxID=240159 RepID=A0A4U5V1W8_COLLU|nr:Plectin [Collichthys lucidus]
MVAGMLMPLRDLRAIYEVLFRDGVMVAKKDKRPQTKHPEIEGRVRKPTATLAIAHRAARVQSVEGPTSYVPKPGRRAEGESQEGLAERQGYRHKMTGPGERESYSDRTPRFRGRPLAAEPARPKASWEVEEPQPLFRKPDSFRSATAVVEESRVKRASLQQRDVSSEKPVTSQERKVPDVQIEKAPISVQVQRKALKQDVSQTALTSVSSKTTLALTVAAVTETTVKLVTGHSAITKLPDKEVNEEKTKKTMVDPVKTAVVRATPEVSKSQATTTMAAAQETSKLITEAVKEEKTRKVIVDPVKSVEVKATSVTASNEVKAKPVLPKAAAQKTSKLLPDTDTVITKPVNTDVKIEKTEKVMVDLVKSIEVKATPATATDKAKDQAVIPMAAAQESTKLLTNTVTTTTVITKPVSKVNVKEEKLKGAKIDKESVKPAEVKTPVKSKIDHEKAKQTLKINPQETTKPSPASTTSEPVLSAASVKEVSQVKVTQEPIDAKMTTVSLSTKTKTDEVPQETTVVTESSILKVKTNISTTTTVTKMITKQETTDVKEIYSCHERRKRSARQGPRGLSTGPHLSQNAATTEMTVETKQVVELSSKSKRRKRNLQLEMEKTSIDKPPEEVIENTLQPTPVITSEVAVCTSIKTEGASPKGENNTQIDGKPTVEAPKKTVELSEVASQPLNQVFAVPPVELPNNAQVKEKVEESSVSKITQGPVCSREHMEPVKSKEMTATKVETVMVQKITEVELTQASPKPEEKSPAPLSEAQEATAETKSLISTGKAAEESLKSKKKGKGKKQAQTPLSDTINTKPVFAPESTKITSLPKATVKDSAAMASEQAEVIASPKMTPERMCTEETRQAAAVLSEAPADKGEVEPELVFAEKIKREVPKPKTSSTAREAHAAGELASAAPVEAAVAQAQASPLAKEEEPPKVAQHSASQTAERSTEKRLSVFEALEQEGEKKRDLEEDTPSATATPAAAQPDRPLLEDTCEPASPDIDEAAMRRKIVVVEEIVEVKQVVSPQATGEQSPPPPVQPEVEGEELDLDVLEAIAIERALLSGVAEARVQGASPEEDWDHSLEEPEEKTWPNFVEVCASAQNIVRMKLETASVSPPRLLLYTCKVQTKTGITNQYVCEFKTEMFYGPEESNNVKCAQMTRAWHVIPPPLATGEQADGSKQQAQPVKIQHKRETRRFTANIQEPLLSSLFILLHNFIVGDSAGEEVGRGCALVLSGGENTSLPSGSGREQYIGWRIVFLSTVRQIYQLWETLSKNIAVTRLDEESDQSAVKQQ